MKDIAILSISFVWIISFLWFNRAWKHLYVGEQKTLIFLFTPFMLPLYLYYAVLQLLNSPMCMSVSYKSKRRISKLRSRFEFYDWICFFLPLARVEFFDRCLRQFYFDTDSSWSDSIAEKVLDFLTNVSRVLPFNQWAHKCGQKLIVRVTDSKYLTTDTCRLYDKSNVYFDYKVCFGKLKITKREFYKEESGEPANYFLHGFVLGEELKVKKEVIFNRFIFTRKQMFKAFKDLHEQYPDYWDDVFWLKYSEMIKDLEKALLWLTDKEKLNSPYYIRKFKDGFAFNLMVMIATTHIVEEDLDCSRHKLMWKIEDNHRHLNKEKLSFEIKEFIKELKKIEYEPKMIWERLRW